MAHQKMQKKFIEALQSPLCKQVNAALLYSEMLPYIDYMDWPIINKAIVDKWSKSGLTKVKTMAWQLLEGIHLSLGEK